jgi:hypothetical protein
MELLPIGGFGCVDGYIFWMADEFHPLVSTMAMTQSRGPDEVNKGSLNAHYC